MLTEDGKHLYVSYDEYHNLIEKLALKVYQSGWQFDTILCLARGGMRPGDILSRVFDKPLAIMSTSSYRADAGTVQGHLDIARFITTPKGEIAGRVLLVDDLADTGHTRKAVFEMLKRVNVKAVTENRPDRVTARLREQRFHLLFVDLQMPGMDGFALVKKVRQLEDDDLRNLPVIALSARFDISEDYLVKEGFTGYLTKPFSSAQLRDTLLKYLQNHAADTGGQGSH